MYTEDELLMLSGLQHLAYCERQWGLIHLECCWADSFDTVRGDLFHERAHTEGYSVNKGVRAERSVRLTSYQLGLSGIADIVEFVERDQEKISSEKSIQEVKPIEYKVGKPKMEDWDRLQVCAQALCLEEMYGYVIEEGALFYGEIRKRETLVLTQELRARVKELALRMHELFDVRVIPRAEKGSKCKRCSLVNVCMPEMFSCDVVSYWENQGFLQKKDIS